MLLLAFFGVLSAGPAETEEALSGSRLSDQPIPLATSLQRPKPLLELGDHFLDTGKLQKGITLPGGAVWQPSVLLYGTYQTAVETFDDGRTRLSEWANRLDVFANLQLTGTERALVEFRPLDKEGRFWGYELEPKRKFERNADGNLEVAFFEGNLREMFPKLDLYDARALSYGFTVGRQPLLLQNGLLLNDTVDCVGVVRNSLYMAWAPSWRVSLVYGWDHLHRNDNLRDDAAQLFALSNSVDLDWTTIDLDSVYVNSNKARGDGFHAGLGAVQRVEVLGETFSTTFRVLGSHALNQETPAVGDGVLLFTELGRTPEGELDWTYLDGFSAIGKFSSAARSREAGGPLGRTGILFEALELGRYGAALGNQAKDSAGAAVGYQRLDLRNRRQWILEMGGRIDTNGSDEGMIAWGGRLQQAVGGHLIVRFDSFVGLNESRGPGYGGRTLVILKF